MNYLQFTITSRSPEKKTDVWEVASSTAPLGQVRFYPQWRKYCFFPTSSTLLDPGCLREIADFCESQTKAWRTAA